MSVFKKIGEWWKSTEPINRDELAEDFDAYMREKSTEERATSKVLKPKLEQFVRVAFGHLEETALEELVKRVHKAMRSEGVLQDAASAVRDGLTADIHRTKRIPYGFVCDARYYESYVPAHINKILKANGIQNSFEFVSDSDLRIPAHLIDALIKVLEPTAWMCVGLDTESDEYCFFITRRSVFEKLLEAAANMEVSITDKPHLM
jgi:hypothetical protein